jgi:DNA recombination-dependent growth factor C
MKNLSLLIVLVITMFGCAPGTTPSTSNAPKISENSPEAEARNLTTKMKDKLLLDATQEDKILMINVVNNKVIKRLRENNETDKLSSTKEKFHTELKAILSESQFSKFLIEFPGL